MKTHTFPNWAVFAFMVLYSNYEIIVGGDGGTNIVAYFASWAKWRKAPYSYPLSKIDGNLMTHLVYAFAKPLPDGSIIIPETGDLSELKDFKDKYPNVKVLISVGGEGEYSLPFGQIAKDHTIMQRFAREAKSLLLQHNLDGLDLDWEFPKANQKTSLTLLLKTVSQEFAQSPKKLFLFAAISADIDTAEQIYDIPEKIRYVDKFNVMSYDYHGSWNSEAGHNCPLRDSGMYNVEKTIDYYLAKGLPPSKIHLGIPFYGRSNVLRTPTETAPGSLCIPGGMALAGPYTQQPGYMSYFEIKELGWPEHWDDVAQAPYTYNETNWVSYDNPKSIAFKIKYGCQKSLAGYMIWEMSLDDTSNSLIKQINSLSRKPCLSILPH